MTGGDGFEHEGKVFSEINITPLTDVFLVLLIIFMVGASMAVDVATGGGEASQGLEVELPRGESRDVRPGEGAAVVFILSDGRVVLEGEETPDDLLGERLGALLSRVADARILVHADAGASHGRVVRVMEAARQAGFVHLALATRGD
ncbi:MAG TPA: biopolymer transporter ExbD [Fredinandcohnia sp.]|nr:biopolymer transporter ExbD [Fredinandcohnia sp.]